jgi:hypothetical protein
MNIRYLQRRTTMRMMRMMLTMVLGGVLMAPASSAAQVSTCGTATLRDVEVVTELVPQATITTAHGKRRKPGVPESFEYTTPSTKVSKRYLVTIRLNGMVYTAESSGDAFWEFNPTRLVINDAIHACVTKDRLRLTRPDGKEYSPKIVRAFRDLSSSSPERPTP